MKIDWYKEKELRENDLPILYIKIFCYLDSLDIFKEKVFILL